MKNKRNTTYINGITKGSSMRILMLLGLLISVVLAGCIGAEKEGKITPIPKDTSTITQKETPGNTPGTKTLMVRKVDKSASSTSTPITIEMAIPLTLSSNNVAEVNIMVKSVENAPNTKVDLILPEGVSLVSDKSTWEVNLTKDVPVNLSARIKIISEKEIEISAVAKKVIDKDNSWGDIDVAYIGFKDASATPGKLK